MIHTALSTVCLMLSGKKTKPDRSFFAGMLLVILLASTTACTVKETSFSALLARIDQQGVAADTALYQQGFRLAKNSAEKLRLLKRAASYNPAASIMLAREFMNQAQAEPVALVFFDALVSAGDLAAGLQVWRLMLDNEIHDDLLAELLVRAVRQQPEIFSSFSLDRLTRLAVRSNNPDLMLTVAIEALRLDQAELAASLLHAAASRGLLLPARLLWDLGLEVWLLKQYQEYTAVPDLPYVLKAAYQHDELDFALNLMADGVDGAPISLELKLAQAYMHHELARRGGLFEPKVSSRPLEWPSLEDSTAIDSSLSHHAKASAELHEAIFLRYRDDDLLVIRQYLTWLLATRQYDRFHYQLDRLALPAADLALFKNAALLADGHNPGAIGHLLDLLAQYPNEPEIVSFCLLSLLHLEAFQDFARQWQKFSVLMPSLKNGILEAYYQAWQGDYAAALQTFGMLSLPLNEALIPYNSGILELKQRHYRAATDYFRIAAGRSAEAIAKAATLLWAARSQLMLGAKSAARALAETALSLDQDSVQSRFFLLQLGD